MAVSFTQKVKTLFNLIKNPKELSALISLRHSGFLVDEGWFKAFNSGKPVDKNYKPIPWFTYSAVDFLSNRLNKQMIVLEFGSGNSTLYFGKKVEQVVAVEHDVNWYNKLKKVIPQNVNLVLSKADSSGSYINPITEFKISFDIIVIDGLFRNECCKDGMELLSSAGVIILDDSERTEYREGINNLISKGFRRIDFWGISAGYLYNKATSIFYQSSNCLKI